MRRVVSVLMAAGVLATAGCAPGESLPFVQFETSTPGVGDAALLEGVVVDHGGCLGVESEGHVFVPVFPNEMERRAGRMRPGNTVSFGGGVATWQSVTGLPEVVVPGVCADAGDYWLVVDS